MVSRTLLFFVTLALAANANAFKSPFLEARHNHHHHNAVAQHIQPRGCRSGPNRADGDYDPAVDSSAHQVPSVPITDNVAANSPIAAAPATPAKEVVSLSNVDQDEEDDGDVGTDESADAGHPHPHPASTSTTDSLSTAHVPSPALSMLSSLPSPGSSIATASPTTNNTDAVDGEMSPTVLQKTAVKSALTPNGVKAGIAGGDSYNIVKDHIGWWYDWSPNPSKPGKPIAVPMLWGGGTADAQDAQRLAAFRKVSAQAVPPKYVLGYEEPDCPPGSGSAGMSVDEAVAKWEQLIAPMKKKGALIGSPSMCKQADETWLVQFQKKIKTQWDFTAIHINKNNLAGVKKDIDHYSKYGKPIWVTEFACVNDNPSFVPCTSQSEINKFINDIVPYLEAHPNVYAYAYSNGLGLGNVWPMGGRDGKLSASGKAYLAAISRFH